MPCFQARTYGAQQSFSDMKHEGVRLVYYKLVRVIFCAGIGWLIYCFAKKQIASRKHRKIFLGILMIIMMSFYQAACFFPLENYIYSFSTPEEIFRYTATGEILGVVEGKESCMIVYQRPDNAYSNLLVRKENGAYKIIEPQPIPTFISVSIGEYEKRGMLDRLRDGTDVYLTVSWLTQEDEAKVEDNAGSTFHYIVTQDQLSDFKTVFSYAYIENYAEDYEVTIG